MITHKDEQYMDLCEAGAAIFATCSKRQYFSIIVDRHGYVSSLGYNGGPSGTVHCADGGCPRAIAGSAPGSNYDNCISAHAEQNALLHGDYHQRVGGTLYINGAPCFTCAKLVTNSGVARIVCYEDPTYASWAETRLKLVEWGIVVDLMEPRRAAQSAVSVSEPVFSGYRSSGLEVLLSQFINR